MKNNSSEEKTKFFQSSDYLPKRFGLKYGPPQIILEYQVKSTGKLYHHKIKLIKLQFDSNIKEVLKEIYERHYRYLDNKKIHPNEILKLVEKLKAHLAKLKPNDSKNNQNDKEIEESNNKLQESQDLKGSQEINKEDLTTKNLNKLTTEELNKYKAEMEKDYQKNAILPESEKFVYDIQKEFEINDFNNDWDDEDEEV